MKRLDRFSLACWMLAALSSAATGVALAQSSSAQGSAHINGKIVDAGFNLSNLACTSPNNCQSAASKTVFRPWENLALQPYYTDQQRQQPDQYGPDPASCEPVVINLPFTPSNPLNK
jgi:hypothetical protein